MINILLAGCGGRMGRAVALAAEADEDMTVCAGLEVDPSASVREFPIFTSASEIPTSAAIDVIIDFSHHTAVNSLIPLALERNIPAVICATGHTDEEISLMKTASEKIPVFYSRNMSLGINLLTELVKRAAAALGEDCDIEIVEAHHNQKLDAPSGTALMLADAASSALPYEPTFCYDRHDRREKRPKHEIGLHSIRGGTIVGEHEVIFACRDEVIRISHSAYSREVFASGAIRAARFIIGKAPGFYSMTDVVNEAL